MNQLAAGIAKLRSSGLQLRVVNGRLKVEPLDAITPEMDGWVRDHAREIKGFLAAEQGPGLPRPNTTATPDIFFDEIAPTLNERELRVMLYIIRRTYGFKKEHDAISLAQFTNGITTHDGKQLDHGTGLCRSSVILALKSLEKHGFIEAVKVKSTEHGNEASHFRMVIRP